MEFTLPHKCQKQVLVQVYESTGKEHYKLVEFYDNLEKGEQIYNYYVDGTHPNKKPISLVSDTKNPSWIAHGQTRNQKPSEKDAKNIKLEATISLPVPCMNPFMI